MDPIVVDAKYFAAAANILISLVLSIVPVLRVKWAALNEAQHCGIIFLAGGVVGVATWLLGCYAGGFLVVNGATCTANGWGAFLQILVLWGSGLVAGFVTYGLTPQRADVKAMKLAR